VRLADGLRTAGFIGGGGVYGVLLALLLRTDAEATRVFHASLVSGANLEPDSPILRYRNRSISERVLGRGTRGEREVTIATGIKAWNAWRKGETTHYLAWRGGRDVKSPEPFPLPV
jgi:hypothetical protein